MGSGGAGVVVMSVVFVIELAGKRRRGVMIGVVNTAYTLGVSVGAAVYGVLQPVIGWVSFFFSCSSSSFLCVFHEKQTAKLRGCQQQRSLFWLQSAIILLAGFGLYLSLPESMSSSRTEQDGKAVSLRQKLANIDYLGAVLLVRSPPYSPFFSFLT